MRVADSTVRSGVLERAWEAARSRFQRAIASELPYYAQLYDDCELGVIFGEREFRVHDERGD